MAIDCFLFSVGVSFRPSRHSVHIVPSFLSFRPSYHPVLLFVPSFLSFHLCYGSVHLIIPSFDCSPGPPLPDLALLARSHSLLPILSLSLSIALPPRSRSPRSLLPLLALPFSPANGRARPPPRPASTNMTRMSHFGDSDVALNLRASPAVWAKPPPRLYLTKYHILFDQMPLCHILYLTKYHILLNIKPPRDRPRRATRMTRMRE